MRSVACVRYESPSHGWTAVPQSVLRQVLPKGEGISKLSYYDPKTGECFLEEDCQLPKAKAYRLARLDLTIGQLTLACPISSNLHQMDT